MIYMIECILTSLVAVAIFGIIVKFLTEDCEEEGGYEITIQTGRGLAWFSVILLVSLLLTTAFKSVTKEPPLVTECAECGLRFSSNPQ